MSGQDFQKSTERKLWIFLGILCAFLLVVFIWGAIEVSQGAVVTKTNEITTSDGYSVYNPQHDVARGPDNIIRHAYPTTDLAVNLSYSSDNGTTWTEITILAATYQGLTAVNVRGVCVSSNNTTVVFIRTTDADATYDIYLLIRWGWVGSWDIVRVSGQNSYDYTRAQMAINDTDTILMIFDYNSNGIRWKTFGLGNRTIYPVFAQSPIDYSYAGIPFICANKTGQFWVAWIQWDGSYYCFRAKDLAKQKSTISSQISNLIEFDGAAFGCIPTSGICYFNVWGNYTAYGYVSAYLYYFRDNKNYWEGPGYLSYWSVDKIAYQFAGATHDASGMIYLFYYDESNHKLKGMRAMYNEPAIEWAGSIYDVKTGYTSTDYINCANGIGTLWPQVCGVPVNTAKTGWFMSWIWKDEKGATDDYNYQLAWDSPVWPYIFWAPPVIGNYSLPSWYEAEPYLHDFSVSSGNSPYVWWITWNVPSDGGWFWVDENGTMYGYCPGTNGSYSMTVHVVDFYGLVTNRNIILTVLSRSTGGGTGPSAVSWDWPAMSEQGELWMLLAVVSMVSCSLGLIKRFGRSSLRKRGGK